MIQALHKCRQLVPPFVWIDIVLFTYMLASGGYLYVDLADTVLKKQPKDVRDFGDISCPLVYRKLGLKNYCLPKISWEQY